MNHYPDSIRRKGRISTTDTQHGERAHKAVKQIFRNGSKKQGFEKQIVDVDTAKRTILAMRSDLAPCESVLKEPDTAILKNILMGPILVPRSKKGPVPEMYVAPLSAYFASQGDVVPFDQLRNTSTWRQFNSLRVKWMSNGFFFALNRA
jgi:hypothetical protein